MMGVTSIVVIFKQQLLNQSIYWTGNHYSIVISKHPIGSFLNFLYQSPFIIIIRKISTSGARPFQVAREIIINIQRFQCC